MINGKGFRTMTGTLFFCLTLIGCLTACARNELKPAASPDEIVIGFYHTYLAFHRSGLPDKRELAALSSFLSERLRARVVAAQEFQRAFIARYPDEKPPWVEGDLFSSLFEGPTEFAIESVTATGERSTVVVGFSYRGPAAGDFVRWTDTVVVTREKGQWRIDDLEYHGNWAFRPGNRLSEVLSSQD